MIYSDFNFLVKIKFYRYINKMSGYVVNPHTGRNIKVGGATYNRVFSSQGKVKSPTRQRRTGKSAKRGCSNVGKYKDVPANLFCGLEGGSCKYSYPVNTPGRVRSAKAYARFAPNPAGIKKCADRKAQEQGFHSGSRARSISPKGNRTRG
jgi:hypothetical protein